MAKSYTTKVTMTGRRSYGGVPYGPGDTPVLADSIADHWIGLGVAVAYVEIAAQTPETAPPVVTEPEQAAGVARKAKT